MSIAVPRQVQEAVTQHARELDDLLVPAMSARIRSLGTDKSGAYKFYAQRLEKHGTLFAGYDLSVAQALLASQPQLGAVHEVGIGLGQLPMLLAKLGLATVGFEIDRTRFEAADALLGVFAAGYPLEAARCNLVFGAFPPSAPVGEARAATVLTTNMIFTTAEETRDAIVAAMSGYGHALIDVTRLFVSRRSVAEWSQVDALFARHGMGEARLFLDLGGNGRFVLYRTAPRAD